MVIVRASPRAALSPDKNPTQWPPKSPFQALLSSPSGRKKWQDRRQNHDRKRSTSPSPVKSSSRVLQAQTSVDMDEAGDEDEEMRDVEVEDWSDLSDEETRAQLELARIEAKLKLDAIRRKKRAAAAEGGSERASSRAESTAAAASGSPRKGTRSALSQPDLRRANVNVEVEVPLSPVREHRLAPIEQLSPARRRLGLNGPPRAQDVSLKRARDGTQLKKSSSDPVPSVADAPKGPKGRSFNERLRASREEAESAEAKRQRIERVRSKGFGSQGSAARQVEGRRGSPERKAQAQVQARPSSARETTHKVANEPSLGRSSSTRSSQSAAARSRTTASGAFQAKGGSRNDKSDDSDLDISPPVTTGTTTTRDISPSSFDPFSETHLTKRHIPHPTIVRSMSGKEIYTLPRLLKEVKAPDYEPPDCENDWVLFAVLASKSSPYDQKDHHRTTDEGKPQEDAEGPRNKFMVLKLTDLKWELDCFLFGTAFDQFWKLTPGTLLAILNPSILPPKTNQQHSGKFSLKLGSSEDSVLEVGVARDLGYCSSVKADGKICGEWVDKRSTEICEFHLNLFVEKQRKGRMEVNGMFRSNGTGDPKMRTKSRVREAGGFDKQMRKGRGVVQSREYGTLYSVNTGLGFGKSAASLLDAEDKVGTLEGLTADEKSRARIAAAEKERKLQRELRQLTKSENDSVGAEYMRTKPGAASGQHRSKAEVAREALFEKPKAADLGLLGNKAGDMDLEAPKDRKKHFGLGAVSSAGRDAMGWGGAKRAGLLDRSKELAVEKDQTQLRVEKTQTQTKSSSNASSGDVREARPSSLRSRSQSPEKKKAKTRFLLADKGLREPGRESGGQELKKLPAVEDDEEDDLDIV